MYIKTIIVEGYEVLLDDEDYEYIVNCYDLKMRGEYVYCSPKKKFRGMGLFSMQLQKVLMLPDRLGRKIVVDHRDGNERNNQKSNLRICTHPQNMKNRKKSKGRTSIYKGVSWDTRRGAWKAKISSDNKQQSLGYFKDEIPAASCYNYWARLLHGEFARLNDLGAKELSKDEWESQMLTKHKTSKYLGVSFIEGRWVAQIYHERKNMRIGDYDTEDKAALAYNEKALELKGEKAKLNIINI
jgi:hypothetical protein